MMASLEIVVRGNVIPNYSPPPAPPAAVAGAGNVLFVIGATGSGKTFTARDDSTVTHYVDRKPREMVGGSRIITVDDLRIPGLTSFTTFP